MATRTMQSATMPRDMAARLVDPRMYGEFDPVHADWTWLRANMPLSIAEADGYDPFWVVTKYHDIEEIGRQPALFANNGVRKTLINRDFEQRAREMQAQGREPVNRSLLTMDDPEHMRYRLITQARFAPKGIRGLEKSMREIARRTIDNLSGKTECEFMDAVANRYPLRVIISLLDLPPGDEDMLLDLTQRFFNPRDVEVAGEQSGYSIGATSNHDLVHEMKAYFTSIAEDRRAHPRGDVASVIANARIGGQPIPMFDVVSYYMTVATAGHDTTASSTGGAVRALAENPAEFAKVKADRSLIPLLVNEAVRWTSPVNHFMRTATTDYDLRGQHVRKGDWLMLCYPSANRDEDVFEDPFVFKADRHPNPHLGFGYGAHVCLGQHLARMEMTIFMEEFFERVDWIEPAGEARRTDSILVGGLKRLPVRYRLA
jgi:cytochrome P450